MKNTCLLWLEITAHLNGKIAIKNFFVKVEWYLMMQCGAFVLLWFILFLIENLSIFKFFRESLNLEDAANPEALDNFNFPLNEITEECFVKVVEWLRNHQGLIFGKISSSSFLPNF